MQHLILKLYGATPRDKTSGLGIRKADDEIEELVYVGYPDRPVTAKKAEELALQAQKLDGRGYRRLVLLAWDYEYNYHQALEARIRALKDKIRIKIESRDIPPDIYDYLKKAKSEEDIESFADKVRFYERPYLRLAEPEIREFNEGKIQITISIKRYETVDFSHQFIYNYYGEQKGKHIGGKMKYLTTEEEQKFFDAIKKNKMHSAMFQLMLDYGMRISEIVRLKKEDVDMENRRITITRSKRKREPTNDYRLTDECYKKLKTYLKEWRKKEVVKAGNLYLFISQKTTGINEQMRTWNVGHLFRKYASMAGISKTNPHCLRHTCAVRLASKGLSEWDVKDRLWHSSVISSQTYVQLFGKEKIEQDRRCEEALRGN